MSDPTGSFPRFDDGNVKIILSHKPADTLLLHSAILGRDQSFFKASLEKLDWADNKELQQPIKLLELDLDGSDGFPLLLGKTVESPAARLMEKVRTHDEETDLEARWHKRWDVNGDSFLAVEDQLTLSRYHSSQIITAHKIGFALIYNLRIEWPAEDMAKAASVIPAVVDFADAYGLLPSLRDRISTLIFGHKWSGFDVIAAQPFQMLRVACKLQSEVIYKEAMKHAVAIHRVLDGTAPSRLLYSPTFLSDIGETGLDNELAKHAQIFRETSNRLGDSLLGIRPLACNKIGVAEAIGVAIFRDWVIKNIKHAIPLYENRNGLDYGLIYLSTKSYDISHIMTGWSTKDWHGEVGVRFGHVHRAVESCFSQARGIMDRAFDPADTAKGTGRYEDTEAGGRLSYFANLRFRDEEEGVEGSKYPWATKAAVPGYVPSL